MEEELIPDLWPDDIVPYDYPACPDKKSTDGKVRLADLFLSWKLEEHIANGVVRRQKHPFLPLYIYNYTEKAQYDNLWDSCTMKCRGLIVMHLPGEELWQGRVVARAYDKFFNLNTSFRYETQEAHLPTDGYAEVTEKLDGSLGILWEIDNPGIVGGPENYYGIASRGSFDSEQSRWASVFYYRHHKDAVWPKGYTPVFEIIYNENRIVCKYEFEGLVLTGLVNKKTGVPMKWIDMVVHANRNRIPCVPEFDKTLAEVMAENTENKEGYVLRYFAKDDSSCLMVKVKFEDYCRLHRVITGLNPKDIWEMLSKNQSLDPLLGDDMPEHFKEWLLGVHDKLIKDYVDIKCEAYSVYSDAASVVSAQGDYHANKRAERKAYADIFTKHPRIAGVLFAILDGKDISPVIWKLIKPSGAVNTFRKDGGE